MIELSNVALPLDAGLPGGDALVRAAAARALGVSEAHVARVEVLKRSVDARKKGNVHFVATLAVALVDGAAEERLLVRASRRAGGTRGARGARARRFEPAPPLEVPDASAAALACGEARPVVVGAGPAGLFCALYLAKAGLRPLLVERGGSVEERCAAVTAFDAGGPLDPQTNVQFGEGGAGTFSDGKLATGIKSPHVRHVLEAFVRAGAPQEILWQAKPHIGTDLLPQVVRALRERIVALGGEVRFHAQLTGLHFEGGALVAVDVRDTRAARPQAIAAMPAEKALAEAQAPAPDAARTERVPARRVVLACGHSARDTFEAVRQAGLAMERKAFSVGVRIEHPQALIDRAQYGAAAGHPALGAADYRLAVHLPDGRGVYTFCMCPGGTVVAAASEEGGVCTNGMSRFARDGENANSALLVEVRPDDLPGDDVLAGVALQRRMERAAYRAAQAAGGAPYAAPAQTVGDFLAAGGSGAAARAGAGCSGGDAALAKGPRAARADGARAHDAGAGAPSVRPSYPRGVTWCDLRECLPGFVSSAMAEALPLLDAKLHGFADPRAVMTGVETRSSSPVRIVRGADFQATMDGRAPTACKTPAAAPVQGAATREAPAGGAAARGERPATDAQGEMRQSMRACAPAAEPARGSGLYPCGEGAGYAGGIMSAAVDGLRVAEAIVSEVLRAAARV